MSSDRSITRQAAVQRAVVLALLFMMLGTAMELYLLDHYEDVEQLIPLLCIGVSLPMILLLFFGQSRVTRRIFKLVMALTALSGVYGTYLHLAANFEFEQEMRPAAENWDLFTESLSGALPALAPASMIVLALIGYSYYLLITHQQ